MCIIFQFYSFDEPQNNIYTNLMSFNIVSNQHCQDSLETYKKIENYIYFSKQKLGQGKGNFSDVYKGIDQNTGKNVAIKVIKYASVTNKVSQQLLKNEVMILKQVNHQYIIKCMDVFTSKNNCYIVTQYCENGDLQTLLYKKKCFSQKQIAKIIYGIYKALVYLNEKHIVHRDLKPANILMADGGIPKIGDFGFAIKYNGQFKDIRIGSLIYMSPQGLLKHEYGPKSQVWSFGVLIYQLLHGQAPLSNCKDEQSLKETILKMPEFKQQLSFQMRKMLQYCFTIDIKARPSIKDLGQTKFMLKIINQFQKHNTAIDMYSTYHTNLNFIHLNSFLHYVDLISTYEEGLSILQYCRLVHKTSQLCPSKILSRWLLDICGALQTIKITNGEGQNNHKLIATIYEYYSKYKHEHLQSNINVDCHSVLIQCEHMKKMVQGLPLIPGSTQRIQQSYLSMLIVETQMLQKFLQTKRIGLYSKFSQIQKFLQNIKGKRLKTIPSN